MDKSFFQADSAVEFQQTLHELNQRYRQAWERAEQLQDELNDIKHSRAYRAIAWLRRAAKWLRTPSRPHQVRATNSDFVTENLENDLAPACGMVSILIPFKDHLDLLQNCIRSLQSSSYPNRELLLLNNGSTCPRTLNYLQWGQADAHFRVVDCPGPFNFARICNLGAQHADNDFLLFLNNDIEVLTIDWLEHLLKLGNRVDVGVVGATLLYPDRTIQHVGVHTNSLGAWSHPYRGEAEGFTGELGELTYARSVPAVTGACLLIRRTLFAELGGFDEAYPLTFNDIDLCLRVRQRGLKVGITPHARLWHFESMSRGYTRELPSLA